MQLEQQETFEIKSPQLEVFGQVESKLPAPAKKRPFAAGFLAVMVQVSVFGIGGVQLKSRYRNVAEIYTSEVDKHGNSIQGDFTTLTDTAANLMRACQKVLGEADSNCTTVADLLAQWQDTAIAPAAQYAVIHQLDNAVDAMYTAAKAKATDDALDQINSLDASYVSTQSILHHRCPKLQHHGFRFPRQCDRYIVGRGAGGAVCSAVTPERRGPDENFDPHRSRRSGGCDRGGSLGGTGSGSCFRSGHQQYQLHCR